MNRWVSVVLAALAMSSAPLPMRAQTRGSAGSRPPQGSANRHPGPSRPSPSPTATIPPFRSPLIASPTPAQRARSRSAWFGLVLFDPYSWMPISLGPTFFPPPASPPTDPGFTGGLQLDVEPRRAAVFVDGSYVGLVHEFSGYYHHLDLAAGPHRIELVAADYDPLLVEVVVSPSRTTTYRGSLNRR